MGNTEASENRNIDKTRKLLQTVIPRWIERRLPHKLYSNTPSLLDGNHQDVYITIILSFWELPRDEEFPAWQQHANHIDMSIRADISLRHFDLINCYIPLKSIRVEYLNKDHTGYNFRIYVAIHSKQEEVSNVSTSNQGLDSFYHVDPSWTPPIPNSNSFYDNSLFSEPPPPPLQLLPQLSVPQLSAPQLSAPQLPPPQLSPQSSPSLSTPEPTREDSADLICKICMSNRVNVAFVPCGHTMACSECSTNLKGKPCPMCREPIRKQLRLFIG